VGGFVCCRCGEVVLVDFSFPGKYCADRSVEVGVSHLLSVPPKISHS